MELVLLADRPQAAEQVAAWHWRAWGQGDGLSRGEVLERVRAFIGRRTAPLMVLAVDGGQVVGCAQLQRHEVAEYPDFELWLGGVFVAEQRRGEGVASALVGEVVDRARAAGVEALYLQTEELTGGLYRRHGFEPVEEVDRGHYRAVIMKAELGDRAGARSDTFG